jgi:hypothetical protein
MITFTASPKFFAPVTLNQLDAQGALKEAKFDAQFKRLKQSEFDALMQANHDKAEQRGAQIIAGLDVSAQAKQEAVDLLNTHMVGWAGVRDEGQNPVPFSTGALAELCEEHTGLLVAIVQAFYASFSPAQAAHLAAKN